MTYSLSPTDLTFLYEECSLCFYRKVKHNIKRPFMPFPSVFGQIDKCMRQCYHGFNPAQLHPDLPNGVIDTTERKIKSSAIAVPGHESMLVLSGKMDALSRYENATVGVEDFKTSDVKEKHLKIYERQNHAYRTILMNPAKGNPEVVSTLGLVCVTPTQMTHGDEALFSMKLTYVPMEIDDRWWNEFLGEVITLLDGPEPKHNEDCHYCWAYRGKCGTHEDDF